MCFFLKESKHLLYLNLLNSKSFTWLFREKVGPCASCVVPGGVHCISRGADLLEYVLPDHMGTRR